MRTPLGFEGHKSLKELELKIKQGEHQFFPEYYQVKYELIKEQLVDLEDTAALKRSQGAARLLRDLITLTSKVASK